MSDGDSGTPPVVRPLLGIGETFFTLENGVKHLYVVILQLEGGKVVLVNMTSSWSDRSCEFEVGEHPFIEKNTVINYNNPLTIDVERQKQLRDERQKDRMRKPWMRRLTQLVPTHLIKRIQGGALTSKDTPRAIQTAIRALVPSSETASADTVPVALKPVASPDAPPVSPPKPASPSGTLAAAVTAGPPKEPPEETP